MTSLLDTILDISRQRQLGKFSPWFTRSLEQQIEAGIFLSEEKLDAVGAALIQKLAAYRAQAGVGTTVLGMSGGVDSALTAVMFKHAGWRVVGFTLPIEQDPAETERGVEACEALGIEHHNIDLTTLYHATREALGGVDPALITGDEARPACLRRGNLRARLRMVTLYNMAAAVGGVVASTDNYSELGAGFWTLHGDVGDISPIQALLKSWEVPYLAKALGVPRATWSATPTDGLGTGGTDEQQIGATYLEWDIMVATIQATLERQPEIRSMADLTQCIDLPFGNDARAVEVFRTVTGRMNATWYKRINPIQFEHPTAPRLAAMARMDRHLFQPKVISS